MRKLRHSEEEEEEEGEKEKKEGEEEEGKREMSSFYSRPVKLTQLPCPWKPWPLPGLLILPAYRG